MITAEPVEPLYLRVGSGLVGGPPVQVLLVERVIALQHRVGHLHRARASPAMGILPRTFGRVEAVLDMLDVLAALEQQDLEAFLRELLRGPSAGYARSHDDGVIALRRHEPSPSLMVLQSIRGLAPLATSHRSGA